SRLRRAGMKILRMQSSRACRKNPAPGTVREEGPAALKTVGKNSKCGMGLGLGELCQSFQGFNPTRNFLRNVVSFKRRRTQNCTEMSGSNCSDFHLRI